MMSAMPILSLVAALDTHYAIGKGNALPWHLPDDLRHFKALTLNKPVLMGRKTAQSLGRALPKRRNLVLTRSGRMPFDGMQAVASLEEALHLITADGSPELCVIGGGELYTLALPHAHRLHLTHVETAVDAADAYFPQFAQDQWRITRQMHHPADAIHAFAFSCVDYERQ